MALCLLPAPCPASPHRVHKEGLLHQLPVEPVVGGGPSLGLSWACTQGSCPGLCRAACGGCFFLGGGVLSVGC